MTIVEELRQNRESGARRLEAEYKAGLMTLARRFYVDPGDAEELVNATFAAVVDSIDNYLEQSAFFGWMCQILTNIYTMDVRRKSNQTVSCPGVVPDCPDYAAQEAIYDNLDAALLRKAIDTLPRDQREAIALHYFMDMPVAQIAKYLSVPNGTVLSRLHYARKALAAKLGAKAREAAKKPGAKALLVVLALGALTALGAAIAGARAARPQDANADEPSALRQDAAQNRTGGTEGTEGTGETSVPDAAFISPVAFVQSFFESDSSTTQPSQKETTMNATTLRSLAAASIFSTTLTTGATMAGLVSDQTLILVDDAMPSGYFSNVVTGEQALALTGVRSGNQYFSRPDDRPAVWLASWSGGMCEAVTNANSHYINGLGTCANITDSSPSYALSDFTFETFFKQASGAPGYQYYRYIFYHSGAWALRVVNNWLYLVDMASNATLSGGEISNAKWHHIAVVQDRQAGTMSLYVDYTLKGSLNYVVDAASTLGVPSFSGRANGANVVDAPQQAYYDAIRLTAKALAPEEFIISFERAALLQGGDTLVYLSLDATVNQDYTPMPLTTTYKANPDIRGFVPGVEPLYPTASSAVSLVHTGAWHMVKSESDPNSDYKGGGFKVADTSPSFTESSFTAELFFKPVLASPVNDSYVFAGGTTFNVWVTRSGFLYATAKGSSANVGYTAGSVVDGAWHHVAYVWDKERGTAEIWLDHQMLGRATGLTRLAADGKEPNATFFIGGWNEWDYGLNKAFGEVTFDEIRITKRALKATEFFTVEQLGDFSPLAWARFSGDLSLGDEAGCYAVTGKVASGTATFATKTPKRIVIDAAGNVLDDSNQQALSLEDGQVTFPANGTLDADAFTLEAFVRLRGADGACNVAGLYERNLTNLPVCVIQTTGAGGLAARVVTTEGVATVPLTASAGGSWHHVAVSVESSGGMTAVKTYWDHALAGETSVAGAVDLSAPLGLVCGDGGFSGLLDEVRLQQGAVGPEGQLYVPPPEGFVIVLR